MILVYKCQKQSIKEQRVEIFLFKTITNQTFLLPVVAGIDAGDWMKAVGSTNMSGIWVPKNIFVLDATEVYLSISRYSLVSFSWKMVRLFSET